MISPLPSLRFILSIFRIYLADLRQTPKVSPAKTVCLAPPRHHPFRVHLKFCGLLCTLLLLFNHVPSAAAQTSPPPTDAEIQGQKMAQTILQSWPNANLTNTGILKIRNARHQTTQSSLTIQTLVQPDTWENDYQASNPNTTYTLKIIHSAAQPSRYFYQTNLAAAASNPANPNPDVTTSFAGSDFWLADLGLEFFHWPAQKILKKEARRSRGCTVLESTNPHPDAQSYSRVVSWIDEENNGIVHAEAYDSKNNLLKEFDPKTFKKVNGQWELQEMEINNVQSGTRTRWEFDLPSH